METWIVSATRFPLNYNSPLSFVVEAETDLDAAELIRQSLRDLAGEKLVHYDWKPAGEFNGRNYFYVVRKDDRPKVKGKIIGRE